MGPLANRRFSGYTDTVTKVESLEREVKKLDKASLEAFRDWFHRYDADAWDLQMQKDARSGKLDALAKDALAAHKSGKTRAL